VDCAPGTADPVHWDEVPLALTDGKVLRAVTAAAARAGIRAAMSVTEAESRCAGLEVLTWDQVAIDDGIRRATAAFLAASPQVTPVAGAPGLWWIGATGLDALGGEPALAKALLAIARQWHPGARVAIADSCVAARAGTWEFEGRGHQRAEGRGQRASEGRGQRASEGRGQRAEGRASDIRPETKDRDPRPATHDPRPSTTRDPRPASHVVIPPGHDSGYLATVPIGLIPMDEVMREALWALGIRVAGGLAALPPDEIEQRWGRTGLLAWRLARGEDRRRPGLATADHPRAASADLVPSVATTEPVLFLVRAALERLLRTLVADGRAAATIALTLTLDDSRGTTGSGRAHTVTREVRLAHPMARLVPLFERCRALLDRWPLPAPVSGVTVAIVATAPLTGEQGDLLDPAWRDPAAADAAFARLRVELGADAIVVPVTMDEHRPERTGRWDPLAEGLEAVQRKRRARAGRGPHAPRPQAQVELVPLPLASRLLDPPEPVDVECADRVPCVLRWRGRRMRLADVRGPERLSGDWWHDGYARDYWRCGDPDGDGTLILCHDRSSGSGWFVQGWED
jgi:protein ImuB